MEKECTRWPQDPIGEIIRSLHERDEQRQKAVELANRQVQQAATSLEREAAASHVANMQAIWREFRASFPEVFPSEDAPDL